MLANNTSTIFHTYGPNRKYATLEAYGKPSMIVTIDKQFYDCEDYFRFNDGYVKPDLIELLDYATPFLGRDISGSLNPDSYITRTPIVYANYFLSPWYKPIKSDELYYRLCDYKRFSNVHPCYYGTNYGRVWSTKSGCYLSFFNNRPNKDGNAYQLVRLLTNERDDDGEYKRRTLAAHWIAGYFVPNSKPDEYTTICHKDNNPTNNSYKNLYWGTQDQNLKQAWEDNRITLSMTERELTELVDKRNTAVLNKDPAAMNMLTDYAKNKGITVQTVYNLLKSYNLKDKLIPFNINTSKQATNKLPINECLFLNDYGPYYQYAKLDSLDRPDVIVTCFGNAFKIAKKDILDKYFPSDKSKWLKLNELLELDGLVKFSDRQNSAIRPLYNRYTQAKSTTIEILCRLYFGESPWYRKYGLGEDIDFVQMNKHSEFPYFYPSYFLSSDGKVFNISIGRNIAHYFDAYGSPKYSITTVNTKEFPHNCITKSPENLLKMFNFRKS